MSSLTMHQWTCASMCIVSAEQRERDVRVLHGHWWRNNLDLDLPNLLQVVGGREHFLEMSRLQTR
jgi:hypothetical protein